MRYWTECREFFREFRHHYSTTGSILPSSPCLGRALISPLRRRPPGPASILEVGPGTGAVTVEILRQLRSGDQLDLVEINCHFVAVLERRFVEEPLFRNRRRQVRLMHAPLQEVIGLRPYDYIISCLPHNSFSVTVVRDLFHCYRRLLKTGGVLSFYVYPLITPLKMAFGSRRQRRRLHVLQRLVQRRIRASQIGEQLVFFNLPPAIARHLRLNG